MRSLRAASRGMQRLATLLLFAAVGTFSSPAVADDFEDEPFDEFCLPQEDGPQICIAFFLDDDGYELCLMDEKDRIARCMRSWRLVPDQKPDSDPRRTAALFAGAGRLGGSASSQFGWTKSRPSVKSRSGRDCR